MDTKKILLQNSFVAGLQFTEYSLLAKDIDAGDRFSLKREPDNKYDPNAVAIILAPSIRVGYIPKGQNELVARLLDEFVSLETVVTQHDLKAAFQTRLQIAIYLLWPVVK
jgi:hypothetical protein